MPALTVYSTSWCGPCVRLKNFLEEEGIEYAEVDIKRDADAAKFVVSVNRGMRLVPTVVFPDGSVAPNPSPATVLERLRPTG